MTDAVTKNALRPVITQKGLEAALAASTLGKSAKIVRVGLTEKPGTASDKMTALPGESLRLPVADGTNVGPYQVNITALLNESHPTLSLCGMGFYLEDGTLFAVYLVPAPFLNHPAGTNTILSLDILMNNIPGDSIQVLPTDLDIDLAKYVRITRTVNGKALSADIVLTPADVKAFPKAGGIIDGSTTIDGQLLVRANGRAFRAIESNGYVYLQAGKLDSDEADQKMVLGGYNGKPLSFFRMDMKAGVHPFVRQSGVDYRIYHQGYKPTAKDVKALPEHGFGMGARQSGDTAPDAQQFTEDKSADFNALITSGEYSVSGAWLNHPGNTTAAAGVDGVVKVQARKWGSGLAYKQTSSWAAPSGDLIEAVRSGKGTYPDITWSKWKRFGTWDVNLDYRLCIDTPGASAYPYMVLAKPDNNDAVTSGYYTIGQIEMRHGARTDPNNPASAKLVSVMNAETASNQSSNRASWSLRDPNNITKALIQMTEGQIMLSSQGKALYWDGSDLRCAAGVFLHTGSIVGKATGYAKSLATDDLDTINAPGVYFQSANVNATTARHYPKAVAGSLVVLQAAGIIQTYHCYDSSEIYTRAQYGSGGWRPWVRQYNEAFKPTFDDVGAAPGGFGLGGGNAVRAPSDDLNLITGSGFFGVGSATKNAPQDPAVSGSMVIHTHWSSSAAMQMFLRYDSDRVYVRRKYNNAWQAWFEVYSTANKPTPADLGAVNKAGDTMTGPMTIKAASSHLNIVETDQSDKSWRVEGSGGNLVVTETGVAARLTLKAGGGANVNGDMEVSGAVSSRASNSFRMLGSPVGTFWRIDGANLYLMKTAKDDAAGNYDASRAFAMDLITGKLTFGEGATVKKELTMAAPIVMGSNHFKGANNSIVLRDHGNGNTTLSGSQSAEGAPGDLYLGFEGAGYYTRLVSLRKRMDWLNLHTLINADGLFNSDKQYGLRADAFQSEADEGGVRHTIVGGNDTLNRGRTIIAAGECGKHIADNTASGDEVMHIGADSDAGLWLHTGLQGGWGTSTHKKVKVQGGQLFADDGTKKVYHQGFKPTPADLGAVNKAGDTLTGKLTGTEIEASLIHKAGYQVMKPFASSYGTKSYARQYYREYDSGKPGEGWRGLQMDAYFPAEGSNPSRAENLDIKLGSNFVYHQGRKPVAADVGLGSVNNWPATSAVDDASNAKYATSGGVKKAYDLAAKALPSSSYHPRADSLNNSAGQISAIEEGDMNTRPAGDFALFNGKTVKNSPHGTAYFYAETKSVYSTGALLQTAWPYDGAGGVYHRNYSLNSRSWSPWRYVYDSGSDPAVVRNWMKAAKTDWYVGWRNYIEHDTNPMTEYHIPGKVAVLTYLTGEGNYLIASSNGAGGATVQRLRIDSGGNLFATGGVYDAGQRVYSPNNPPHNSHNHTAAQGNADVVSGAWNAIGAQIMAQMYPADSLGDYPPGARIPGAYLRPCSVDNDPDDMWGGSLPGTWQCQGFARGRAGSVNESDWNGHKTLWIRVA